MDQLDDKEWRNKPTGSVAIRVPTTNIVSNDVGMVEQVKRANRYIAMGLIQVGITFEEEFLERLDDRFKGN